MTQREETTKTLTERIESVLEKAYTPKFNKETGRPGYFILLPSSNKAKTALSSIRDASGFDVIEGGVVISPSGHNLKNQEGSKKAILLLVFCKNRLEESGFVVNEIDINFKDLKPREIYLFVPLQ